MPAILRPALLIVLAGLALAGCGVRGALEPPPAATTPAPAAATPAPAAPPADRPFILDGLLL